MKPRLADIMREYHTYSHPIDPVTYVSLSSRFDLVRYGLGKLMMEYDKMTHPITAESQRRSLAERLNGLFHGLGPLILSYDRVLHLENLTNRNEANLSRLGASFVDNEFAEKFNAVSGKGYSARQRNILQKTSNPVDRDKLQHFMDLALDLYEMIDNRLPHEKPLPTRALVIAIQNVEDIIYSRLLTESPTRELGVMAQNVYRAIENEGPPISDAHMVLSELVAVVKDKRGIEVPLRRIVIPH